MPKRNTVAFAFFLVGALSAFLPSARAWDHGGHMTTAAIAFAEIERARPDLIEKLGLLFLTHPQPASFWVAAGDSKGTERVRRMFMQCARWPDDVRWTIHDRPAWHTARWPIVAKDATPEAKVSAKTRGDQPTGQAIEALELNFAVLANPEAKPAERATALCWVLHLVGDIHQPLHTADVFSKDFPEGNAAGTMQYVADPLGKTPIPLHMLWDSNILRTVDNAELVAKGGEYVKDHPRSSLRELGPKKKPAAFREWARESYEVARKLAYRRQLQYALDPNQDTDPDRLVRNMVKFVLEGLSPVETAPELPADYWKELQRVCQRRITLAGYRIADLILSAAARIEAQRPERRVP